MRFSRENLGREEVSCRVDCGRLQRRIGALVFENAFSSGFEPRHGGGLESVSEQQQPQQDFKVLLF
jgi:hypothetical protein